jgi:hypothetical protein
MTLLVKKAAGLGLVLLGGLAMVHGIVAEQPWETLVGLGALAIGAWLLAAKVLRRNAPHAD